MQSELINQGLELMLYGMGTVILFLSLLVLVTRLMSTVVNRFAPAAPPAAATPSDAAAVDPQVVAAITAAIHQHRSRR